MSQFINQEVDHITAALTWPKDGKWLWGPDGNRARFDSPADVPRDYTEARQYAKAPVMASSHAPAPSAAVSPELIAAVKAMVLAEIKAEQREKMANARAAKAPKD